MTESEPETNVVNLHETLTVRIPHELYRSLEEESARTGKSVNDIVVAILKLSHEAMSGKHE
jgi:hypothetical protein